MSPSGGISSCGEGRQRCRGIGSSVQRGSTVDGGRWMMDGGSWMEAGSWDRGHVSPSVHVNTRLPPVSSPTSSAFLYRLLRSKVWTLLLPFLFTSIKLVPIRNLVSNSNITEIYHQMTDFSLPAHRPRALKRLREVGNDVVDMLGPDRNPNAVLSHSGI